MMKCSGITRTNKMIGLSPRISSIILYACVLVQVLGQHGLNNNNNNNNENVPNHNSNSNNNHGIYVNNGKNSHRSVRPMVSARCKARCLTELDDLLENLDSLEAGLGDINQGSASSAASAAGFFHDFQRKPSLMTCLQEQSCASCIRPCDLIFTGEFIVWFETESESESKIMSCFSKFLRQPLFLHHPILSTSWKGRSPISDPWSPHPLDKPPRIDRFSHALTGTESEFLKMK